MKKEICIIDDDTIYQILMNKILKSTKIDHAVTSFLNGKEAIESFYNYVKHNENLPSIIFLDIEMPLMDGWDFMTKMNKLLDKFKINNIKIYIVSSSISHEDIEKSKTYKNIVGFYSKPLKIKDILEIIK